MDPLPRFRVESDQTAPIFRFFGRDPSKTERLDPNRRSDPQKTALRSLPVP